MGKFTNFAKLSTRKQYHMHCMSLLMYIIIYYDNHHIYFRVRDEIQMTIAAYQTLYESSIAFGMRKALMAEQGKVDLEERVRELEEERRGLGQQVSL